MNIVRTCVFWAQCQCRAAHGDHSPRGRDIWMNSHIHETRHPRADIRRWEAFR